VVWPDRTRRAPEQTRLYRTVAVAILPSETVAISVDLANTEFCLRLEDLKCPRMGIPDAGRLFESSRAELALLWMPECRPAGGATWTSDR